MKNLSARTEKKPNLCETPRTASNSQAPGRADLLSRLFGRTELGIGFQYRTPESAGSLGETIQITADDLSVRSQTSNSDRGLHRRTFSLRAAAPSNSAATLLCENYRNSPVPSTPPLSWYCFWLPRAPRACARGLQWGAASGRASQIVRPRRQSAHCLAARVLKIIFSTLPVLCRPDGMNAPSWPVRKRRALAKLFKIT